MEFCAFTIAYLDALRAGDPPTEQHFVAYFSQLLVIKLRARRCDAAEIDEIRQETFVRVLTALRKRDGVREAERFGAYVNSVCNNVFLERLRAARRSTALDGEGGDIEADVERAWQAHGQVIDLESMLVTEQARQHVRAVLDELSGRDQHLLRAIFFEERPKDEICREFGVDREYLRVLLHRAKQHFRQRYTGAGRTAAPPAGNGHANGADRRSARAK
jgi:RNA polymerase sigma-70 factor (ECF subfamily)